MDPVVLSDGHAFERKAIEKWLRAHDTSPLTGARLVDRSITPCVALRQLISARLKTPA